MEVKKSKLYTLCNGPPHLMMRSASSGDREGAFILHPKVQAQMPDAREGGPKVFPPPAPGPSHDIYLSLLDLDAAFKGTDG